MTSPGLIVVVDKAPSKCLRTSAGLYTATVMGARSLLTTRIVPSWTTRASPSLLQTCTPASKHMKLTAEPERIVAFPIAFSAWLTVP